LAFGDNDSIDDPLCEQPTIDSNAAASVILEKLVASRAAADEAGGSDDDIREAYLYNIEVTEPVLAAIQALQPPFDELIEFKLNFKVKSMVVDVNSEHELLVAYLRHLLQGKEGDIVLKAKIARIDDYKATAQTYVDRSRKLEKEIQAVEETFSGTLQEKLAVYDKKQEKVTKFRLSIDALVSDYKDLLEDDFHLEIEDTPAWLAAFIDNLRTHIVILMQAIARERGCRSRRPDSLSSERHSPTSIRRGTSCSSRSS
jgi:actinin alpha